MTNEQIVFDKEDIGLIMDKQEGWRTIAGVIRVAVSVGYPITPSEANAVKAFENEFAKFEDSFGVVHDTGDYILGERGVANRVETWLNTTKAPEGCVFHWHEGAFYLSELPPQEVTEE